MRYIALLRGVNVGGNNKVSMGDLKSCFEEAGFTNVLTYINSGNVIFDSEESDALELTERCGELLEAKFGFPIRAAVLEAGFLKEALAHAPEWWDTDPESKHNAIFVIKRANADEIVAEVGSIKPEYEKLGIYGDMIFWSAPLKTFSRTRFSKVVGTQAYQKITIRNANTAKKLLALAMRE